MGHQTDVVAFYGFGAEALPKSLRWVYKELLGCKLLPIKSLEEAYSKSFDFLLLYGGGDINPVLYGQPAEYPEIEGYNNFRDDVEWILVRRAIDENIPTLGICRGMQMLNVAMGGSLHQDIIGCGVSLENHTKGSHEIEFRSGLFPNIPTKVNSRHHQCVRRLAPGLRLAAVALDGVPEMIYRNGFVGVQWHPESMINQEPRWLNLFQWHTSGLLSKYYPNTRYVFPEKEVS